MAKSQNTSLGEKILNAGCVAAIAAFFVVVCSKNIFAAEIKTGGIIYEVNEETGTAEVQKSLGTVSDLKVKATVKYGTNNYPTIAIDEGAFENTDAISIVLPDSIESIGARAFKDCPFLQEINIPGGLKTVGDEAFAGTTKVRPTFPEGAEVSSSVFGKTEKELSQGGTGTEPGTEPGTEEPGNKPGTDPAPTDPSQQPATDPASTVPTGVMPEEIKVEQAQGAKAEVAKTIEATPAAKKVDTFTLNGSTYELFEDGSAMLSKVSKNKKTLTVPATVGYQGKKYKVVSIADKAAMDCYRLKKAKIGKNVKTIGKQAFSGCSKLKSINLNKVKLVKKQAFSGCKKLSSVKAAKSCKFETRVFKGCKKLDASSLLK